MDDNIVDRREGLLKKEGLLRVVSELGIEKKRWEMEKRKERGGLEAEALGNLVSDLDRVPGAAKVLDGHMKALQQWGKENLSPGEDPRGKWDILRTTISPSSPMRADNMEVPVPGGRLGESFRLVRINQVADALVDVSHGRLIATTGGGEQIYDIGLELAASREAIYLKAGTYALAREAFARDMLSAVAPASVLTRKRGR